MFGRAPINDKIMATARELLANGTNQNRAMLRRIVDGKVKTVDVEEWRCVNGVASFQVDKKRDKQFKAKVAAIRAMADPLGNPNEHQRKVAEEMLAKVEAAGPSKAPRVSAPGLEAYDREEARYRAALDAVNERMHAAFKAASAARQNGARPKPGVNTTKPRLKPPPPPVNTTKPKAAKPDPVNTTKKPRSADRHLEPNRDRHSPGYMREYMRRRRAAQGTARGQS